MKRSRRGGNIFVHRSFSVRSGRVDEEGLGGLGDYLSPRFLVAAL